MAVIINTQFSCSAMNSWSEFRAIHSHKHSRGNKKLFLAFIKKNIFGDDAIESHTAINGGLNYTIYLHKRHDKKNQFFSTRFHGIEKERKNVPTRILNEKISDNQSCCLDITALFFGFFFLFCLIYHSFLHCPQQHSRWRWWRNFKFFHICFVSRYLKSCEWMVCLRHQTFPTFNMFYNFSFLLDWWILTVLLY